MDPFGIITITGELAILVEITGSVYLVLPARFRVCKEIGICEQLDC